MRKVSVILLLAFAVSLAVVVGNRMSTEAMAVVVGVICGVAAGIPMSILLLLTLNRKEQHKVDPYEQPGLRNAAYPPVVVIQGGMPMSNSLNPPYYPVQGIVHEPEQRQFRVVGEYED